MPTDEERKARYEAHLEDVRRWTWFVYAGLALAAAGLAGVIYLRFARQPIGLVIAAFAAVFLAGVTLAEYGRRSIVADRKKLKTELGHRPDPAASAQVDLTDDAPPTTEEDGT